MIQHTHRGVKVTLPEKAYSTVEMIDFNNQIIFDESRIAKYFGTNPDNFTNALKQLSEFKVDYTTKRNIMEYFKPQFDRVPPDIKDRVFSLLRHDPYRSYQDDLSELIHVAKILNHHDVNGDWRYSSFGPPKPALIKHVDELIQRYIKMTVSLNSDDNNPKYMQVRLTRDTPGMTTPTELAVLNQPGHIMIENIVRDLIYGRINTMPETIGVFVITEDKLYLWSISDRYRESMRKAKQNKELK